MFVSKVGARSMEKHRQLYKSEAKGKYQRVPAVSQRATKMHQLVHAFLGTRMGRTLFEERAPFGRHLVDFWVHFGGHWISKAQIA